MKTKLVFTVLALGALALEPCALAAGRGGGGGDRKVSRPSSGGNRPQVSKPSGGGDRKISKPSGGSRLPDARPAQRPEAKPQRPSGSGSGLPSFSGGDKPKLPDRPSKLPAERPQYGGDRPKLPDNRPSKLPDKMPDGGGDFLGMRPDKPNRPTTLPGNIGDGKPGRPTTLPGNIADGKPNRPDFGNRPGGDKPNRPDFGKPGRPTTLPGNIGDNNRPNRPNLDNRPGKPQRPPRPDRPDKWQNVHNNNANQWNKWQQDNSVHINNIEVNRTNNWNNINNRYNERGWAGRYGSDEYWGWRRDVNDFRRDRCEEVWFRRGSHWNDCFDHHWWGSCWWRPRPIVAVGVNVSPWWWWRPFAWASAGAFFGTTLAPQPVVYDPGTTVIYEGDTYYVDGKPSGTATAARQSAIQLATPVVEEIPVPEPVAEGQPEAWLPLGVWALTQQEQGDATMFMQFSVDKNGILAGAYKNVMTGDEQPIIGQLDRKTQRIAWHVGEATQTVYETGFPGLENDVVSVFVHFGEKQTQTWLLVRLPSP